MNSKNKTGTEGWCKWKQKPEREKCGYLLSCVLDSQISATPQTSSNAYFLALNVCLFNQQTEFGMNLDANALVQFREEGSKTASKTKDKRKGEKRLPGS